MSEPKDASKDTFFSSIRKKIDLLTNRADEGAVETLSGNRKLLDTGEIVDEGGKLWGYRLYKGIPGGNWDSRNHRPSFALIPSEPQQYAQNLVKRIKEMESTQTQNFLTPLEKLALLQAEQQHETNMATSWSREPNKAAEFASDEGTYGVVLQLDVPERYCVSQEKLKQKFVKNGFMSQYPLPNDRAESEREVTVFTFIDFSDPNLVVTEEREFWKKNLPAVREKFRKE